MMLGFEVPVDQVQLSVLGLSTLTGKRTSNAGHVQLSGSRLG
jgi:hypothetical protein